jgi:hypothetical protein
VARIDERSEGGGHLPIERDRYGSFTLTDGDFVVFDRRDPDVWLRSSVTVDIRQ